MENSTFFAFPFIGTWSRWKDGGVPLADTYFTDAALMPPFQIRRKEIQNRAPGDTQKYFSVLSNEQQQQLRMYFTRRTNLISIFTQKMFSILSYYFWISIRIRFHPPPNNSIIRCCCVCVSLEYVQQWNGENCGNNHAICALFRRHFHVVSFLIFGLVDALVEFARKVQFASAFAVCVQRVLWCKNINFEFRFARKFNFIPLESLERGKCVQITWLVKNDKWTSSECVCCANWCCCCVQMWECECRILLLAKQTHWPFSL